MTIGAVGPGVVMSTAKLISDVLRVDRLATGDRRLVRDLVIDLGVALRIESDEHGCFTRSDAGTTVVRVPEGFETDFSSIPVFARMLYRFDSVDLAGCCHDLAYRIGVRARPGRRGLAHRGDLRHAPRRRVPRPDRLARVAPRRLARLPADR